MEEVEEEEDEEEVEEEAALLGTFRSYTLSASPPSLPPTAPPPVASSSTRRDHPCRRGHAARREAGAEPQGVRAGAVRIPPAPAAADSHPRSPTVPLREAHRSWSEGAAPPSPTSPPPWPPRRDRPRVRHRASLSPTAHAVGVPWHRLALPGAPLPAPPAAPWPLAVPCVSSSTQPRISHSNTCT